MATPLPTHDPALADAAARELRYAERLSAYITALLCGDPSATLPQRPPALPATPPADCRSHPVTAENEHAPA